jgi:preprotein translocase subunit SecF
MEIIKNPNFEVIGYRKQAIAASLVIIFIGLVAMVIRGGPKYGIDFTGGAAINFSFAQDIGDQQVRDALRTAGIESFEVTHFGDKRHVLVRLKATPGGENYLPAIQRQFDTSFPDNKYVIEQNDLVGPKIGTELKEKALLALLFSWIGMIIYISLRFETESFLGVLSTVIFSLIVLAISTTQFILTSDVATMALIVISMVVVGYICVKFNFKYAVGAIVSLIHDVLVTLSIFFILGKEIDLTIVAALLTIVGFSVNDTIVLFDRIREEYPKERKRLPLDRIINNCINHVLSRTIITSFTVFLVVLILLFFGGDVIRPFSLAMLVGVVAGTYSSVYMAAPILIFWHRRYGAGQDLLGSKATV